MAQSQSLGLTPRRTRRHVLECLVPVVGAWPAALFGLTPPRQRQPAQGEQQLRERVRHYLHESGYSRARLADAIGVSPMSVTNALNGNAPISPAWIPLLEKAFGLSRGLLLQGISWKPRKAGRPKRRGPPPPRRRRRELSCEQALRLRLRQLFRERRLTQTNVASALSVQQSSISAVLTGRAALPPAWLKPLAALLGLSAGQIIDETAWLPRRKGHITKKWLEA